MDGEHGVGAMGYGGFGRGRLYAYPYTVTTRMSPALRWVATRAILMSMVSDKVTRQCPQTTAFRTERRAEAESSRGPSAYQPG